MQVDPTRSTVVPGGSSGRPRITVVLAERHRFLRRELRKLLETESDLAVVGEASSGRQAITLAIQLRPAVLVMDISMPLREGLETTRQIRQAVPETKVLLLSTHRDAAYRASAAAMGAAGYLLTQTAHRKLTEAIRTVHRGTPFFSATGAPPRRAQPARAPRGRTAP